MTLVLVPVRYPLSQHSKATLQRAIEIAEERDADLTVFHVDLYQEGRHVTQTELKRSIEQEIGELPRARFLVRRGFLVEETILEEAVEEEADVVVIGSKQEGRFRSLLRRVLPSPDIDEYLAERYDCSVVTVDFDGSTEKADA